MHGNNFTATIKAHFMSFVMAPSVLYLSFCCYDKHVPPSVCLFYLYLTSCWKLSTGTWNASVSQQNLDFWLTKMWKNGCVFVMCVICSPRWLVGGDPDSCKGYPVYSRLISTLVFHLHHERDGDAQEILIPLAYYEVHATTWRCGLTCPHTCCIIICLHTLKPQSDRWLVFTQPAYL